MSITYWLVAALLIAWSAQVVICGAGYAFVLVRKGGRQSVDRSARHAVEPSG
jgi:uncharacterized membrane protein YdjX (TVP38/TMEM64 family)